MISFLGNTSDCITMFMDCGFTDAHNPADNILVLRKQSLTPNRDGVVAIDLDHCNMKFTSYDVDDHSLNDAIAYLVDQLGENPDE